MTASRMTLEQAARIAAERARLQPGGHCRAFGAWVRLHVEGAQLDGKDYPAFAVAFERALAAAL